MTAINQDVEVRQGEDLTIRVNVTNTDGTAKTITGATVTLVIVDGDTITVTKVSGGAQITVGTTYFDVAITKTDTAALTPGNYRHQAQVTLGGIDKVTTEGIFKVVKSPVGLS